MSSRLQIHNKILKTYILLGHEVLWKFKPCLNRKKIPEFIVIYIFHTNTANKNVEVYD